MRDLAVNSSARVARRTVLRLSLGGLAAGTLLHKARTESAGQVNQTDANSAVRIEEFAVIDIPALELPEPGYALTFVSITVPPESTHTWVMPNKEILMGYTLDGIVQYQVTGHTDVIHADGSFETLDSGAVIDAVPGDVVIEYEFTENKTYANPSPEEAIWLTIELDRYPGDESRPLETEGGELNFPVGVVRTSADWEQSELSGMPVRFTLRRLTVAPGGMVEYHDLHPSLRLIPTGLVQMTITGVDGTPQSPRLVTGGLSGLWTAPETSVQLRNLREEPVEVYELIASARDEAGTPSPVTPAA